MAVNGSHIKSAMAITKIVLEHHKITATRRVSALQPIAKAAAELVADGKFPAEITTIADEVMHRIITEKSQ